MRDESNRLATPVARSARSPLHPGSMERSKAPRTGRTKRTTVSRMMRSRNSSYIPFVNSPSSVSQNHQNELNDDDDEEEEDVLWQGTTRTMVMVVEEETRWSLTTNLLTHVSQPAEPDVREDTNEKRQDSPVHHKDTNTNSTPRSRPRRRRHSLVVPTRPGGGTMGGLLVDTTERYKEAEYNDDNDKDREPFEACGTNNKERHETVGDETEEEEEEEEEDMASKTSTTTTRQPKKERQRRRTTNHMVVSIRHMPASPFRAFVTPSSEQQQQQQEHDQEEEEQDYEALETELVTTASTTCEDEDETIQQQQQQQQEYQEQVGNNRISTQEQPPNKQHGDTPQPAPHDKESWSGEPHTTHTTKQIESVPTPTIRPKDKTQRRRSLRRISGVSIRPRSPLAFVPLECSSTIDDHDDDLKEEQEQDNRTAATQTTESCITKDTKAPDTSTNLTTKHEAPPPQRSRMGSTSRPMPPKSLPTKDEDEGKEEHAEQVADSGDGGGNNHDSTVSGEYVGTPSRDNDDNSLLRDSMDNETDLSTERQRNGGRTGTANTQSLPVVPIPTQDQAEGPDQPMTGRQGDDYTGKQDTVLDTEQPQKTLVLALTKDNEEDDDAFEVTWHEREPNKEVVERKPTATFVKRLLARTKSLHCSSLKKRNPVSLSVMTTTNDTLSVEPRKGSIVLKPKKLSSGDANSTSHSHSVASISQGTTATTQTPDSAVDTTVGQSTREDLSSNTVSEEPVLERQDAPQCEAAVTDQGAQETSDPVIIEAIDHSESFLEEMSSFSGKNTDHPTGKSPEVRDVSFITQRILDYVSNESQDDRIQSLESRSSHDDNNNDDDNYGMSSLDYDEAQVLMEINALLYPNKNLDKDLTVSGTIAEFLQELMNTDDPLVEQSLQDVESLTLDRTLSSTSLVGGGDLDSVSTIDDTSYKGTAPTKPEKQGGGWNNTPLGTTLSQHSRHQQQQGHDDIPHKPDVSPEGTETDPFLELNRANRRIHHPTEQSQQQDAEPSSPNHNNKLKRSNKSIKKLFSIGRSTSLRSVSSSASTSKPFSPQPHSWKWSKLFSGPVRPFSKLSGRPMTTDRNTRRVGEPPGKPSLVGSDDDDGADGSLSTHEDWSLSQESSQPSCLQSPRALAKEVWLATGEMFGFLEDDHPELRDKDDDDHDDPRSFTLTTTSLWHSTSTNPTACPMPCWA